jgi:hypothetical protein
MKHRFVIARVMLTLLCLAFLSGCYSGPTTTPETLTVPERADTLVRIDVSRLLDDSAMAELYAGLAALDPIAPSTLDLALEQLKKSMGFDIRHIDQAVFFADSATVEESVPYGGALLVFDIPAREAFALLQVFKDIGFQKRAYCDCDVYEADDGTCIAFLSSKLAVVGPRALVEEVINVRTGDATPMHESLRTPYEELASGPPVKFVSALHPLTTGHLPVTIPIDQATGTLSSTGSTVLMELTLTFPDDWTARHTADVIERIFAHEHLVYPQPEIGKMIDRIQLVTREAEISIQFEATVQELCDYFTVLAATAPNAR